MFLPGMLRTVSEKQLKDNKGTSTEAAILTKEGKATFVTLLDDHAERLKELKPTDPVNPPMIAIVDFRASSDGTFWMSRM